MPEGLCKVVWSRRTAAIYILASCHFLSVELATTQPSLSTKPSASHAQLVRSKDTQADRMKAGEIVEETHGIYEILKSTPVTQASTTTTAITMSTVPAKVDTTPLPASTGSSGTTSVEPSNKDLTVTIPIVTSYFVSTSSVVKLQITSKSTVVDYVTPKKEKGGTSQNEWKASSSPKRVMSSSEGLGIKSSKAGEHKGSSTASSGLSKQISWLTPVKKEIPVSPVFEIMVSSSLKKQVSSPPSPSTQSMQQRASLSTLRNEPSSFSSKQASSYRKSSLVKISRSDSVPSASSVVRLSRNMEINTTLFVLEKLNSSLPFSSSIKMPMSSQVKDEFTPSKVINLKTSSNLKERAPSTSKILMSSSRLTLFSPANISTSSPLVTEITTLVSTVAISQNVSINKSLNQSQESMYSQTKEGTKSYQAVETVTPSHLKKFTTANMIGTTTYVTVEPSPWKLSPQASRQNTSSSLLQLQDDMMTSLKHLVTSSLPMTARVLLPSTPEGEAAKASSQSSTENSPTSEANVPVTKPVKQTTSLPEPQTTQMKTKPVTEHPTIHHNESTHHSKPTRHGESNDTTTHHSKPTHHGESNDTHKNDSDHTGPHGKMGHPHEPSDADALTEGNKVNEGWQISIYIVVSLISGIIAFVIVMVVKSNRQMRHVRLRESQRKRKRELAREKAAALKAIKTEEPKPHTEKKKDDNRLSFLKHDPEESIPLLELHITDGEAPVLSGHLEKQRPQDIRPTEPSTFDTDTKPPMEENANIPPETPTIQIA